ncbi:sulfatase [Labilibaculum antarcticum]|uniref:Sulfatase n=1 Tax=Labilibaculum antarcticum TaxID=1717717 RepID=A0A1Y1CET0_9BACT|nr:sulfatase [Labilibaculum antarcticum]BAX78820.1 sulfatase [Labilibaculum antarcticum]
MKSFYMSVFFLLCTLFLTSCKEKVENVKPNILFILADDFGYYDTGIMGSKYYETPNIDKIASEGMNFTNGYANCSVCSPSRASIMTGKYTARHGITDWIGAAVGTKWRKKNRHSKLLPPDYKHQLDSSYVTMPEALKEEGYKTFFTGKWHLGGLGSSPGDHGFDINKGGWESGSPKGGYFSPWVNPSLPNVKKGENLSMRLANETINFMKENKDTTFFAFLSFYAVHGPIQTTQEKWGKYQKKAKDLGIAEQGFKMGHFLPIRQVQDNPIYGGLVETMDDAIGKVMNTLKEMGLDENTIVIFTSDNGGVASGDSFSTSNLPLRGGKGYQFEGGIREPYFIKVPGLTNGQKNNTPVTGTDFFPTLLELVGADLLPEEHSDGVSLVPLLKGGTIAERPLIWHYPHYGNQGGEPSSIIREGNYKLIHYYEDGHNELYNLKNDIEESINIAENNPGLVKKMNKKLFDYLHEVGAKFPEKDDEYNAELEKQYLESVVKNQWPKLEKQRMKMLSKDFDPDNSWWGSSMTID